jgi:hypothetical protein
MNGITAIAVYPPGQEQLGPAGTAAINQMAGASPEARRAARSGWLGERDRVISILTLPMASDRLDVVVRCVVEGVSVQDARAALGGGAIVHEGFTP